MRSTAFNAAFFLDRLAIITPPYIFAVGGCVLALRIFLNPGPDIVGIVVAAAGILWLALAVVDALSRSGTWYTEQYAAAWLDLHNHAGGRILAADPAAVDSAAVLPAVRFGPFLSRAALPAVFFAAALLVPAPGFKDDGSRPALEKAADRLEKRLADIIDKEALSETEGRQLLASLADIKAGMGENSEAAAEALAALSSRLEQAMRERLARGRDALEKAGEALSAVEAAEAAAAAAAGTAGEGAGTAGAATAEIPQEMPALEALQKALESLSAAEGGSENLPESLREALAGAASGSGTMQADETTGDGTISASVEDLRRLTEALSGMNAKQLAASTAAGFSEKRIQAAGIEADGDGGRDLGGAAGLVFGDEPSASGARFETTALPLGRAGSAVPGSMLEQSRIRPDAPMPPDEFRPPVRVGGMRPDDVRGGQGSGVLGPVRAEAAARYFRSIREGGASEK